MLLLALAFLPAGAAPAGGSPVGFVSLPAQGTLAVISLPNGGPVARIAVPGEPTSVAASVNGRHVLVASPDAGVVTEIDGVRHRVVRIFHGFSRPVAVALDFDPPIGIVTPRYAYVIDQTSGLLVVLDLGHGRVAARLAVGSRPNRVAIDVSTLWIAHVGSGTLTRVSVATPARPRLLPSVDSGAPVAVLVADPELHSVFVAVRGSAAVTCFLDGDADVRQTYRRVVGHEPLAGLAPAVPNFLIAADRHGVVRLLREQTGRQVAQLRVRSGVEAIDVYGGWLVARLPRALALIGVPDGSMRASVPLGTRVGGFAWAVL